MDKIHKGEDNIYTAIEIERCSKKASINQNKRNKALNTHYFNDDTKFDNWTIINCYKIKYNSFQKCLCGWFLKDKVYECKRGNISCWIGSNCILKYDNLKIQKEKIDRKTYDCNSCNKRIKKDNNDHGKCIKCKKSINCKYKKCYGCKYTQRIYLNVPYIEKDEAKLLGARWDNDSRSWYIDVDPNARLEDKYNTEELLKKFKKN